MCPLKKFPTGPWKILYGSLKNSLRVPETPLRVPDNFSCNPSTFSPRKFPLTFQLFPATFPSSRKSQTSHQFIANLSPGSCSHFWIRSIHSSSSNKQTIEALQIFPKYSYTISGSKGTSLIPLSYQTWTQKTAFPLQCLDCVIIWTQKHIKSHYLDPAHIKWLQNSLT